MPSENIGKLRVYYRSLRAQADQLRDVVDKRYTIKPDAFRQIDEEIRCVQSDYPGLLPSFDPTAFASRDGSFYRAESLLTYVNRAIARLESELEVKEDSPVIERKDFRFLADKKIRAIAERDYLEIQRAHIAQCWKSVIILAGSLIEAILTDCLTQKEREAQGATAAPAGKKTLEEWDLSQLINVAVELKLVTSSVEKLSHSVREYRNIVHPGNEVRKQLVFGQEEARIALEVLHIVHRDLSQ